MSARNTLTALLTLVAFAVAAPAAAGAKSEFRLSVYGMVCNQCAYGVEQSLQHTEGVEDAIVDLRSGSVVVKVNPAAPPSAEVLAQKIRDQRVSLRKMEATLVGRIMRSAEGEWELVAGSQRYRLAGETEIALDRYAGQTVAVSGVFEGVSGLEGAEGPTRFLPREIEAG